MKKNVISVIIPIYNVELYLEKCINSVLNQTYKNLEIILIDDGSTDNSSKICDEYQRKDKRVKVIHKVNGGLSDARNTGIENANGDYLCFIDSDDYIEKDMLENLYKSLLDSSSDISCCGKVLEYDNFKKYVNNNLNFCVSNEEALKKLLLKEEIDNSACDKLFKKELFDNLRFPVGKYYEDIAIVYKTFILSKKVIHISNVGYHYFIRNNSISNEKFSSKQFDSLIYSRQVCYDITNMFPNISNEAQSFYFLELSSILRKMKRSTNFSDYKEQYKKIKSEFNKNIFLILKNKCIPNYKKIMCLFIYLNCYKFVEFVYKKTNMKGNEKNG